MATALNTRSRSRELSRDCRSKSGTLITAFQLWNPAVVNELFGFVFNGRSSHYFKPYFYMVLFQIQTIRMHIRCKYTVGFVPGWGPSCRADVIGSALRELTRGRGHLNARRKCKDKERTGAVGAQQPA